MCAYDVETASANAGNRICTPAPTRESRAVFGSGRIQSIQRSWQAMPYWEVSSPPRTTIPARDRGDEKPATLSPGGSPTIRDGRSLGAACTACGARCTALPEPVHSPPSSKRSHMRRIVALNERPKALEILPPPIVSQLKDFGLCVIAHEFGVAAWPVGTRCGVSCSPGLATCWTARVPFPGSFAGDTQGSARGLAGMRDEESRIRELACTHGKVGHSEALLAAFRRLVRMSKLSDLPVLITGKSGTGKELFASALHALDPKRCQRRFVAVNCAAINAGVAESELFGHVRAHSLAPARTTAVSFWQPKVACCFWTKSATQSGCAGQDPARVAGKASLPRRGGKRCADRRPHRCSDQPGPGSNDERRPLSAAIFFIG